MAVIRFTLDGIISSVDIGGESISLLEERSQGREDFRRVVKGGQMIDR